jgi:hypothetical protein
VGGDGDGDEAIAGGGGEGREAKMSRVTSGIKREIYYLFALPLLYSPDAANEEGLMTLYYLLTFYLFARTSDGASRPTAFFKLTLLLTYFALAICIFNHILLLCKQ